MRVKNILKNIVTYQPFQSKTSENGKIRIVNDGGKRLSKREEK